MDYTPEVNTDADAPEKLRPDVKNTKINPLQTESSEKDVKEMTLMEKV